MKGIINQVIESNEIEQVIITEGKMTITFKKLPEAVDLKDVYEPKEWKPVLREEWKVAACPKRRAYTATAEQKNKSSLKRVKDKRIKAILEAYPKDTFRSWLAREYVDLCYTNVVSFLARHKNLSVRKACEMMRKKRWQHPKQE